MLLATTLHDPQVVKQIRAWGVLSETKALQVATRASCKFSTLPAILFKRQDRYVYLTLLFSIQ